ncbi:M48 family metallopeptidase [Candidatus Uhrbacteria bacterium]|nr:M48 family metallopeptidase [Candidatus Uhrbacteria bacterium]
MKKVIRTHERIILYTLRKSKRAKHVRISVNCDGAVLVTQPMRVPFDRIEGIVAKKLGWIIGKIDFFKQFVSSRKRSLAEYQKCKKDALDLVQSRIEYFNSFYGFTIGRIAIRNQRTRWGSCSKKGNLNFNYRITQLTPGLIDYIVVHELCHLAELNHSKKFWRLVERTMPKHNELRQLLKQNSL